MTIREGRHRKPIHLAVQSGGQIEFESQSQLAQTAERGLFDFFALADGPGGPDTFTVLAALAGVTAQIGLVGALDTTFGAPFTAARQLATLDHLSGGRAGWTMVIASTESTGANFRRAGEFLDVVREFWDSWDADAVIADDATGVYLDPGRVHTVRHTGAQFEVRGMATLPAGPQGHPVLLQAGNSGAGRDFGTAQADVLFTSRSTLIAEQRYHADVKSHALAHGRNPERLKVLQVASLEQFVGTPDHVAAEIDRNVQSDGCDGFILVPESNPLGLDKFVDTVVPLLQERGIFRTAYTGDTLRDHLGLRDGGLTG